MAEIVLNPDTGMYDAVSPEGEVIYDGGVNADTEIPDSVAPDSEVSEDVSEDSEGSEVLEETPDDGSMPVIISPYSSVADEAAFSPQSWQINMAENRGIGDHYLLWAVRDSVSGYNRYWRYYLAIGKDIEFNVFNDVYTYNSVDLFTYYDNGDTVTYEVENSSGTVDGSQYLVYSDLYFDYVGSDPANSPVVYIFFIVFIMLFVLLIATRRR